MVHRAFCLSVYAKRINHGVISLHYLRHALLLFSVERLVVDGRCYISCRSAGHCGGFLVSLPLTIGAFVAGLLCSVCVGYLKENSRIKEDTAMGIVFSGMFALGIVLFSKIETDQHLTHILFGNLLGVSDAEMLQTLVISAVVFFVIFLRRKDFLLYCFDATQAKIVGLSPQLLHYSLLILLALTIVSAMQVVGVILVVAMLISPGITAFILSKRFDHMIAIALATSISTSLFGTIISYHIDGATGPCIILLQAAVFLTALVYSKIKLRFSAMSDIQ